VSGATGVARDVKPVITLTVANATSSDGSKLSLLCTSRTITFTSVSTLSGDAKSMDVTLTPQAGAILAGDTCSLTGDVSTTGTGGTVKTAIGTSFTIVAAPVAVAKGLSLIVGTADSPGSQDGALLEASFNGPRALSVGADGTVYIADGCADGSSSSHALYRKISPGGQVATIAGSSSYLNVGRTPTSVYSSAGSDAFGGECTWGVVAMADGTLYSSGVSRLIEKISPQGQITSIAGSWGQKGAVDGNGSVARFSGGGVTADLQGNLFVADGDNHVIRRIDPFGNVTTYAGLMGVSGSADGALQTARFWAPTALKFDKISGKLFVSDSNGIRAISNSVVSTLVTTQQIGQDFGVGGIGADVMLPLNGMDVSADGRLAVTYANFRRALIYRNNVLEVRLGTGDTDDVDGPPNAAKLFFPSGVAFLPNGDLLISDIGNNNIKKYSATTNTVDLFAGKRSFLRAVDGVGSAGKLWGAGCLVQASTGEYYFSQSGPYVRKVDTSGKLTSIPPTPTTAYVGAMSCLLKANDDGSFISVSVNNDLQLRGAAGELLSTLATNVGDNKYAVVNAAGDLFFTGQSGSTSVIKKFSNGVVTDFVTVGNGSFAMGMTITDAGDLVVANYYGLYKVSPTGVVTTIAPAGPLGKYDDGAVGEVSLGLAGFYASPVVGRDGAIYIVSSTDSVIRRIYNGRVEKVVGTQWVNETKLGSGPGSIFDARALKYDAKTNSLIIMTGNAILRADLP